MKDATVMVRLTAEQKATIAEAAKRDGLSVSAFVLRAALLAARKGK